DARWKGHAESPAGDIGLMDPLVAEIAAPGVPEPVPVVVKAIPRERLQRRGAGPQVVVHAVGHRFDGRSANRVAVLEAQSARQVDLAQRAGLQMPDRLDHRGGGPALRSVLDDALVLVRGTDELASFPQIVGAGFLDVDVLASLARPYRHQGMPVVRR